MKKTVILITIFCGFMAMVGCGKKNDGEEIIQPTVTYEVSSNSSDVSKNNIEAKEETAISENDGKPAYYDTYAKLLLQFMTDSSCSISGYGLSSGYDAYSSFMLKDLNKDGREELLVRNDGCEVMTVYNILVPADTWEEANLGPFRNYDDATGTVEMVDDSDMAGGTDYYALKEDQLELIDQYVYTTDNAFDCLTKYYHLKTDGTKNEISYEEYLNQPGSAWKTIDDGWIKLTPTSLELFTDVKIEDLVSIPMTSPITVLQYNKEDNTNTQVDYNSVNEFITSNGFDIEKPFHKYRNISEKTQMLLYYNETTGNGCVVFEKNSCPEGYSFIGTSKDKNNLELEKLNVIKNEYTNPFDVSNRMNIYSTDVVANLKENKETDANGNIIAYLATGTVLESNAGYDEEVVSVHCDYDRNNVLRHRAFSANSYAYGTSETPKNTCYDSKGRVTYTDYYMTSGIVYDWYIYSSDNDMPTYNLNIDFGVASLYAY